MDRKLYFRTTFILDNNRHNVKKDVLHEIIIIELFRRQQDNNFSFFEVFSIINDECYLEFTLEDIENSIKANIEYFYLDENKVNLSSEGFKYARKLMSNKTIAYYIDLFRKSVLKDEAISSHKLIDIIFKYIYYKFNEGINAISDLFDVADIEINEKINITEEERLIINQFLNWDNHDKNKCVFETFSKAINYFHLTNNSEKCQFNFKNWVLYLDTNIFFRLAGLNNTNRMELLDRFVEKARNTGIKLKYTNFTESEIFSTIDDKVKKLELLCKDFSPISPNEMHRFLPDSISIDLYRDYYNWSKSNLHTNFLGYKQYLYDKLQIILKGFEKDENCISFFVQPLGYDMSGFLKSMQQDIPGKHEISAKHDINNVLWIFEKNKTTELKHCFVSADLELVNWTDSAFPIKYLVELPSTWHALILNLYGRTSSKDYEAFCKFIVLPVNQKNDLLNGEKAEFLACVQECTTDAELKDLILHELRFNRSQYECIPRIKDRVIKAREIVLSVTENIAYEQGVVDAEQATKKKSDDTLNDAKKVFGAILVSNDAICKEIGKIESKIENEILNINKKVRRLKTIKWVFILGCLILLGGIAFLVYSFLVVPKWFELYKKWEAQVSAVITIFGLIVLVTVKRLSSLLLGDYLKLLNLTPEAYEEALKNKSQLESFKKYKEELESRLQKI